MICIHGDLHMKLHGNMPTNFIEDIQFIMENSLSTWDGKDIILQKQCYKMNLKFIAEQLLGLSTSNEIDELDGLYADFTRVMFSSSENPWFRYFLRVQINYYIYQIRGLVFNFSFNNSSQTLKSTINRFV